jgi:molecular chaperone DnaJ
MSSTREYLDKDLYAVLGLSKGASQSEIKKAYRKLAKELHPDQNKNNPEAEARFKEVSEAYSVLGDEARRKEYDEGRELFGNGGFRNFGGPRAGGGPGGMNFEFNFGDGGLGDILGGIFNRRGQTGARRGADVETSVTVDFVQAVEGVTVPLRLTSERACASCSGTGARSGTTPRVCPACDGVGQVSRNLGGFAMAEPCQACRGRGMIVDDPCPTCHGSGRGQSSKTVQTRIPAGVADGQRIKLKGKGAPGERGGPAGDLFITVHVRAHPVFGRKGDNLTLTLPVSFPEAALGAEVKVPTLTGAPVTLRLAPGTSNGRTMRVRGRGVPRKDGTRGDLLVTVSVAVPANLNSDARKALEAFAKATASDDPRAGLLDTVARADTRASSEGE